MNTDQLVVDTSRKGFTRLCVNLLLLRKKFNHKSLPELLFADWSSCLVILGQLIVLISNDVELEIFSPARNVKVYTNFLNHHSSTV
jgi:hypothetical protein